MSPTEKGCGLSKIALIPKFLNPQFKCLNPSIPKFLNPKSEIRNHHVFPFAISFLIQSEYR